MSNVDLYLEIFESAIYAAAQHAAQSEEKHGVGIKCSADDAEKVITHTARHMVGAVNEDGASHAVAALVRAIKVVLQEQKGELGSDSTKAGF